MKRQLKRIPQKGLPFGLCAGIAYKYGFPVPATRLITALLCFMLAGPFGIFIYLFAVFLTPKTNSTPEDYYEVTS